MEGHIAGRQAFAWVLALAALAAGGVAQARMPAANVALAPVEKDEAASASPSVDAAQPRQIGYPRVVAELQTAAAMGRELQWARVPEGGLVAAVSVTSPGAAALRVGVRVGEIPASAMLRFYAPSESAAHEVTAEALLGALARNRRAGETGSDARTYWSPLIAGDTVVIEVELPAGNDPSHLALTAPIVSHLVVAPDALGKDDERASIVYTIDGSTYACPGSMLAASVLRARLGDPGGTAPGAYFVTQSRCVSSQAAASTAQAFWPRAPGGAEASGVGAELLYASGETDTAFLALDAPPPNAALHAKALAPGVDPALEQWLGAAPFRAAVDAAAFSLP
jgi:lysyl endopeptidase